MAKIGVLYGMEESFPPALVDHINARGVSGVTAEHLKVGGVRMAEPCGYDVIVDRISHDIPFYRSYLKNAVLTGTQGDQQSVLVERRRQVLQLRAGREAGRGRAAHGAAAAQEASHRAPPTAPCATWSIRSIGTASSTTSASRRSSSRTMAAAGRTSTRWIRRRNCSPPTTRASSSA